MSDDDQLDDLMRRAAGDYHRPGPTPREAMWREIQRRRTAPRRAARVLPFRRWLPLAVAALVLLATGVGLGRLWERAPTSVATGSPAPAAAPGPEVNETAYRLATLEHLSQSEEFLTLFRSSLQAGDQRLASTAARRLLGTNRLLLDSPAADDRRTRLLLEDLELVLAGIAQLSEHSDPQELDLIRKGMERGLVMPRLRTAVPSGPASSQGAL